MHRQSGNVLFLILIAVALFAALSYAVTSSSRSSGKGVKQESASTKAAQILQYASLLETTFMRLKISGCDIDEISFEASAATAAGLDYSNPRAPSDKHCHMFDIAGGGIAYQSFSDSFLVASQSGNTNISTFWTQRGHFKIVGTADVPSLSGIPSGDPRQIGDTMIVLPLVNDDICNEIKPHVETTSYVGLYTYQLLGPFPHRHNEYMETLPTREGCYTDGDLSTSYTRTNYYRIISVN